MHKDFALLVLIGSARFTFKDDRSTLSKFTSKTKTLFITSILPNPTNFDEEINGVLEVSRYLRRNIVQGKHSDDGKRLVLRMTKETELGDNESIKNPKPSGAFSASGCCSSSPPPPTPPPPPKLSPAAIERREQRRRRREALTSE